MNVCLGGKYKLCFVNILVFDDLLKISLSDKVLFIIIKVY